MYRTDDKRAAITEVQGYLIEIYEEEDLYKSGVYDKKTEELVIRFQSENELIPSGTVDMLTHEKLYNSSKISKQTKNIREKHGKNISFPIKDTGHREDMRIINLSMGEFLNYYGVHHNIRNHPYFTPASTDAVLEIRKILRLSESKEIDEELYYRMMRDIEQR